MSLSIALIVKNEESTLERCLESVKGLADEIIIVDTGSIDKTIEIAKKYTDKIFNFKWIDDFSAARNFSFDKCSCDFILWIDADDVITPENYEKIKKIDYSDKEIILVKYIYCSDEFGNPILTLMRERIIKRSLGLRWEQPIHEYLPLLAKTFTSDISINHYKKGGTSERNLKILEKLIQKNPKDSRTQYYLGKESFDFGKIKEAKKYLEKFVHNKTAWYEDKFNALLMLAKIHYNDSEFKKYIFKCIDLEERRAESYFLMGQYFFDKNNWIKAIHWFNICINMPIPTDLSSSLLIEQYTWAPALQLVLCYNNIGNIEKARECNDLVLKYRPKDSRALNNKNIFDNAFKKKEEEKKLKIGWIAPINWEAAQTRIRVLRVDKWLKSKGYKSEIVNYQNIIDENYDVVIVGKAFSEDDFNKIKLLKQHNKVVFCDLCEDILSFPWVKEILQICDKIICCSHVLAEKVEKINPNVVVIEDSYES